MGVSLTVGGRKLLCGSARLFEKYGVDRAPLPAANVLLAVDGRAAGAFLLADRPREEAKRALGELRALGVGYSGVLEVLSNLLTNDYLYNNIRAKGGAYGQGIRFSRNGSVSCYSYRDPNLENTIAIYDQMAYWLENLEMSDADLTDVIIGVMNRFNPVMTARAQGNWSLTSHVNGARREDIVKAQEEALATSVDDLRAYAPALRQAMAENHLCVLGASSRVKQASALFDHLIKLEN